MGWYSKIAGAVINPTNLAAIKIAAIIDFTVSDSRKIFPRGVTTRKARRGAPRLYDVSQSCNRFDAPKRVFELFFDTIGNRRVATHKLAHILKFRKAYSMNDRNLIAKLAESDAALYALRNEAAELRARNGMLQNKIEQLQRRLAARQDFDNPALPDSDGDTPVDE